MQNKELLAHIDGCRQGDSKSQRWIFERYYRLMFGVCMRYVSDKDAVQDVVQEGFLKVFTNIEGYTSKGSFEGWMRRIMVNTSIDAIRRRKATGLVLGDEKSFEDVVDEGEEYDVDDVEKMKESLDVFYQEYNLYPLWICPYRAYDYSAAGDAPHRCYFLLCLGCGSRCACAFLCYFFFE